MTIDMKGKPCPIPVVEAKKALRGLTVGQTLTVLVDNDIAVQNLQKMADGMGYGTAYEQLGDVEYSVAICVAAASKNEAGPGFVVAIGRNRMGAGSDALGEMLMKSYIYSLSAMNPPPSHILFFNGGAYLSCEGAATLNDLQALQEKGVDIQTCGACLNYYGLKDKLRVGGITNMDYIATTMAGANRLINL
jgi:selenium metabolism protein YedF